MRARNMLIAGVAGLLVLAGCSNSRNSENANNPNNPDNTNNPDATGSSSTGNAGGTGTETTGAAGQGGSMQGSSSSGGSDRQQKLNEELTTSRVKAAVMEQLQADAAKVDISVDNNGAVKLSGSVNKPEDQKMAEQAAQTVPGVTRVSNDISVQAPTDQNKVSPSDAQDTQDKLLENKVRSSLLEKLGQNALDISISVKDGQVELSGNVPGQQGKQQAVSIAQGVQGVRGVQDKLDVKGS